MAGPLLCRHFVSPAVFEWAATAAARILPRNPPTVSLPGGLPKSQGGCHGRAVLSGLAQTYSCYTTAQGRSVRVCNLERAQNEMNSCWRRVAALGLVGS
ncbi:hypothetical protein HDV64DRAFT_249254 [Trichoderma sp. TUCIM 5745]